MYIVWISRLASIINKFRKLLCLESMYKNAWVQFNMNYGHKMIDESAVFRAVSIRYALIHIFSRRNMQFVNFM